MTAWRRSPVVTSGPDLQPCDAASQPLVGPTVFSGLRAYGCHAPAEIVGKIEIWRSRHAGRSRTRTYRTAHRRANGRPMEMAIALWFDAVAATAPAGQWPTERRRRTGTTGSHFNVSRPGPDRPADTLGAPNVSQGD